MENLGEMNISKEQQNVHSLYNQNETWLSEKGAWLTYFILIVFLHLVLLSVPFFDTATAWTMTNVIHNVVAITCSSEFLKYHLSLYYMYMKYTMNLNLNIGPKLALIHRIIFLRDQSGKF